MRTNLVRSLIAGSVAAVATFASLAIMPATSAQAGGNCTPIVVLNPNGTITLKWPAGCVPGATLPIVTNLDPEIVLDDLDILVPPPVIEPDDECERVDRDNLVVLAAQTTPYDWQWRFRVEGSTEGLCNTILAVRMRNLDAPGVEQWIEFHVFDVIAANELGSDYVVNLETYCHYDTSAYWTGKFDDLDEYPEQHRFTEDCLGLVVEVPEGPGEGPLGEEPAGEEPAGEEPAGEEPVDPGPKPLDEGTPTGDDVSGDAPGTPDTEQDMPHTGSDSTTVMVGLGLLVVGAGLGFTALSLSRRRHT